MNSIMSFVCCVPKEMIDNLTFQDDNSGRNAVYIKDAKTRILNNHKDNLPCLLDLHQDDDISCLNPAHTSQNYQYDNMTNQEEKNEEESSCLQYSYSEDTIEKSRPQYSSEEEKNEVTNDYIETEKHFYCHHPHLSKEEKKDGRDVYYPQNKRIPFGLDQSYHNASVSVAMENMRCFQDVNNRNSNMIDTSLNNPLKYLSKEKENELEEGKKYDGNKNCFQTEKSQFLIQFLNKKDLNRSHHNDSPIEISKVTTINSKSNFSYELKVKGDKSVNNIIDFQKAGFSDEQLKQLDQMMEVFTTINKSTSSTKKN